MEMGARGAPGAPGESDDLPRFHFVSTLDPEVRTQLEGLHKTDQAKLVGKMLAERAQNAGIKAVVFDRGGYKFHGRVKALADASREGGLDF